MGGGRLEKKKAKPARKAVRKKKRVGWKRRQQESAGEMAVVCSSRSSWAVITK